MFMKGVKYMNSVRFEWHVSYDLSFGSAENLESGVGRYFLLFLPKPLQCIMDDTYLWLCMMDAVL